MSFSQQLMNDYCRKMAEHKARVIESAVRSGCSVCGKPILTEAGGLHQGAAIVGPSIIDSVFNGNWSYKAFCSDCKPAQISDGTYYVLKLSEVERDAIECSIKESMHRPIIPLSIGYSDVSVLNIGPNDVLVLHYPTGESKAAEDAALHLLQGDMQRPIVLLPTGYDLKTMPLADLRQFRDRINEAIYDLERGT